MRSRFNFFIAILPCIFVAVLFGLGWYFVLELPVSESLRALDVPVVCEIYTGKSDASADSRSKD